jgi:hypothetical protein
MFFSILWMHVPLPFLVIALTYYQGPPITENKSQRIERIERIPRFSHSISHGDGRGHGINISETHLKGI